MHVRQQYCAIRRAVGPAPAPARMAPLAAPSAPALEAAPGAHPAQTTEAAQAACPASTAHSAQRAHMPQGPAAVRPPGTSDTAQLERSSSRQQVTTGKQLQARDPQLKGRGGSKGPVPDAQRQQTAVIYSLGGSPGSPHHIAAQPMAIDLHAKPAVQHIAGADSGSATPSRVCGSSETGAVASTSKLKGKAGLSIAQQAVLRCGEKQLALGEPHEDLQARRRQLEDASSGSECQHEGMSPSQANGMSRGRMMHAHLAPPQLPQHDSEYGGTDSSWQGTRETHPSHTLRDDSERPLPAGAKRGMRALGAPLHGSPIPDIERAPKPASSRSSSVPSDSRQPERHQHPASAAKGSPQTHCRPSADQEAACQSQCSAGAGHLQPQQPYSAAAADSPIKQIQSKAAAVSVAQVGL